VSDDGLWHSQAVRILMVEDDPADQELLRETLRRNGITAELMECATGRATLERLAQDPLPDIILLDLRLPDVDGLEVLRAIKADRRCSRIPVIVLSMSNDPADIDESYARQASAYLQKPETYEGWQDLVRSFTDYWLKVVLLHRP